MTEYKDKKASLIVFGILELLGGGLCTLFALVTLIPVLIPDAKMPMQQMLVGTLVYVYLTAWLIWMGVGTIRARRWARILMLAGSWLMLACGVMGMLLMFFTLPKSFAASQMSSELIRPVLVVTYLVLAVFYLVLPSVGVLFYGNRNVRATCEQYDPSPSWTERCPLPVLVLVLMLMMITASILMMFLMNFAVPVFGTILSGWQGGLVLIAVQAICIWLAFGVFKLRPSAWWSVLLLLVLGTASNLITFSRIDMMDYYAAMGYSGEMLEQMKRTYEAGGEMFMVMAGAYAAPGLIYLLWLKRYFRTDNA